MDAIAYPQEIRSLDRMVIGAQRCPGATGNVLDVVDPASGTVIGAIPRGTADDVDEAVHAARSALKGPWRELPLADRARLMRRLASGVREHADVLARIECIDVGKPLSQAARDVGRAADYLDYFAGVADKIHGESVPLARDRFCFTVLEPVGVTAHIIPWNFPLSTVCRGLAPALACGNTAVIKPAEQTSLSTLFLANLAVSLGVPAGVINVVTGLGSEAGEALAGHRDIGHLTFTGSVQTGRTVMQLAARPLAGVSLELGGKSPIVVLADCDRETAVAGIVRGIFFNAGQMCTAGSRLIIERDAHDEIVDAVAARAARLTLDHGLRDPDLGPLVSRKHRDRVHRLVEGACAEGAQLITGGSVAAPDGLDGGAFYAPTILDHVSSRAEIAQEEIFGPVLTVHAVADLDEAVAVANDTRFGLVAGIYTREVGKAMRFARDAVAGQVFINGYLAAGDTVPFGGMKESGIGREKGLASLASYCEIKAVTTSF